MADKYNLINEDEWEFAITFQKTKKENLTYSCGDVNDMKRLVEKINEEYNQMREYRRENINLKKKFEEDGRIIVEPKSELPILRTKSKLNTYRKRIRKRDGNVCRCCGTADAQLQVHHIFPVKKYPELVYENGNGITLCEDCHREYHNYYSNCNPNTLMEFLKENGVRK